MLTIADYNAAVKAYDKAQARHWERRDVLLRKLARRIHWAKRAEENAAACTPNQHKTRTRFLAKAEEHRSHIEPLEIQAEKRRIAAEWQNIFAADVETKLDETRAALTELRQAIVDNGAAYRARKDAAALAGIELEIIQPESGFDHRTLTEPQLVAAREYLTSRYHYDIGSGRGNWTRAEAAQMEEATIGRALERLCERTPEEWQARGVADWRQAVGSVRARLKQSGWRIGETESGNARAQNRKKVPGRPSAWGAGMDPATVASMCERERVEGVPYSYQGGRPRAQSYRLDPATVATALTGTGADTVPNHSAEPIHVEGGECRLSTLKIRMVWVWKGVPYRNDLGIGHRTYNQTFRMEERKGTMGGTGGGKSSSSSFETCTVTADRPAPANRHAPEPVEAVAHRRWFAIHPDAGHGKAEWYSHVGDARWSPKDGTFTAEGVSKEWAAGIDARRAKWLADLQRIEDAAG